MPHVQFDQTERVVWLTLARPPLNILSIDMLEELGAKLDEIAALEEATVVALAAADGSRAFSAGVDIDDHTPDKLERMLGAFHAVIGKLVALPQTTVAALDGAALGGGLELALACDIVVASQRCKVGLPEIQLACFPPAALALLPTLCGRGPAADLVLSGHSLPAARAAELGLIARVFADDEFQEGLASTVNELAQKSPAVLRLTTRLLRKRYLGTLDEEMRAAERAYLEELAPEHDMLEGLAAFREKRAPRWGS